MDYQSLQIIGSRTSGGAERFYCRLVAGLHARAHNVLAINPPGSAVAHEVGPSAPQRHVRMRNIWDPLARMALKGLIKQTHPAIVQTFMGRATRLTKLSPTGPAVHIARLGGFYDVHHYRHAHYLIGNTQGICDYLVREGVPAERVFHLPNCVDVASPVSQTSRKAIRAQLNLAQDDWLLMFAGRLHENKGVVHLLDAIATMPKTIADRRVHLAILGDGGLRETLRAHAHGLSLDDCVHWCGWVADPDPWYSAADAFICSSIHEPLGNVVLEAWAHGVPVVATRTDGPVEICTPDSDAILVDIANAKALAKGITELLSAGENFRASLGIAGQQKLAADYSTERVVNDYISLYERLARVRSG